MLKKLYPDLLGAAYLAGVTLLLILAADEVARLTATHSYLMSFAKFAVLASFGECLQHRIMTGHWIPPKLLWRTVIWGVFGMWIGAYFTFVEGGVRTLVNDNLWPTWPEPLWLSIWANVLGGYAFFMMFSHYWTNTILEKGFLWPWQLLGKPETERWSRIVIVSIIVLWIPAHTLTFSLPTEWRLVFVAYLNIALGLILSFAAPQRK